MFIFKVLFKVLFAIAAVFAAVAAAQYLLSSKANYIEIYNDDETNENYF